jgi:hypothetical protein
LECYLGATLDSKDMCNQLAHVFNNKKSFPLPASIECESRKTVICLLILCRADMDQLLDIEKDNIVRLALEDSLAFKDQTYTAMAYALIVVIGGFEKLKRFKKLDEFVQSLEGGKEKGLAASQDLE